MSIALSHSRLSTFNQCPRKFYLQFIKKTFPDDSNNPSFVKGNAIHKQLEDYVTWATNQNTANANFVDKPRLSPESNNVVPIINNLVQSMDVVMGEQQIATDFDWKKCGWFGGTSVKYRAILDLIGMKNRTALVVDYKTGKIRDYDGFGGQLHLNATMIFSIYPEIQEVKCAYLYVDHKHTVLVKFKRSELPQLQGHFDSEHDKVNNEKEFKPKINQYCKWCPATKVQCPFSKQL